MVSLYLHLPSQSMELLYPAMILKPGRKYVTVYLKAEATIQKAGQPRARMESEVPSAAEKAEYRKQSVIGGIENMNNAETRQDSIELDAPDFINAITELGLGGSFPEKIWAGFPNMCFMMREA